MVLLGQYLLHRVGFDSFNNLGDIIADREVPNADCTVLMDGRRRGKLVQDGNGTVSTTATDSTVETSQHPACNDDTEETTKFFFSRHRRDHALSFHHDNFP